MRTRKTVDICALIVRVNGMLAAPDGTPEGRAALAVLLESVLHEANAYAGFNYQASEHTGNGLRPNHDDTRRHYYVKR